jgi:hypothetical protein
MRPVAFGRPRTDPAEYLLGQPDNMDIGQDGSLALDDECSTVHGGQADRVLAAGIDGGSCFPRRGRANRFRVSSNCDSGATERPRYRLYLEVASVAGRRRS